MVRHGIPCREGPPHAKPDLSGQHVLSFRRERQRPLKDSLLSGQFTLLDVPWSQSIVATACHGLLPTDLVCQGHYSRPGHHRQH